MIFSLLVSFLLDKIGKSAWKIILIVILIDLEFVNTLSPEEENWVLSVTWFSDYKTVNQFENSDSNFNSRLIQLILSSSNEQIKPQTACYHSFKKSG